MINNNQYIENYSIPGISKHKITIKRNEVSISINSNTWNLLPYANYCYPSFSSELAVINSQI